MALLWVREKFESRSTVTLQDGSANHTREFFALSDIDNERRRDILSDPRVPQILSAYSEDNNALCIRVNPKGHPDSPRLWVIPVEYSTQLGKVAVGNLAAGQGGDAGEQGGQADENPLNRPPEVEFFGTRVEEAMETDWNGATMQNSSHEWFDPPVVEPEAKLTFQVTVNISYFDPRLIATHLWAVNQATYLGFEANEVLLDDLRAKPRYENRVFYWSVTARFIFSPIEVISAGPPAVTRGGWVRRFLDAGYMQLDAAFAPQRIVVPPGQFPSRPMLLNGNGGLLNGTGTLITNGDPAVYIERRTKKFRNFNDLNLFSGA